MLASLPPLGDGEDEGVVALEGDVFLALFLPDVVGVLEVASVDPVSNFLATSTYTHQSSQHTINIQRKYNTRYIHYIRHILQ